MGQIYPTAYLYRKIVSVKLNLKLIKADRLNKVGGQKENMRKLLQVAYVLFQNHRTRKVKLVAKHGEGFTPVLNILCRFCVNHNYCIVNS